MSSGVEPLRGRVGMALSGADVRIFTRDGELWFAINDLVAALGVPRRTLYYHVGHLSDHEKRHIPRPSRLPYDITVGNVGLHCVSLTGMFKLLLRVPAPAAEAFQNWVCRSLLVPLWDAPQHDIPQRRQDDSGASSAPGLVSP